jgi:hypothetical protein
MVNEAEADNPLAVLENNTVALAGWATATNVKTEAKHAQQRDIPKVLLCPCTMDEFNFTATVAS